jgi:GTP-binding protein
MASDIRNIAIVAHVDHGKTTLVDGMLKQTHTFRDNEAEMQQTTILDSNDLERERGITILAKNTAVVYKGVKINIIDTPGHADFGGEVERVLNMADAALLVVDAAEGPLPQTRFVLSKALECQLKLIVVINKIDKRDARPAEVLAETEELFLRLATDEAHLSFPVVYAVGREGRAGMTPDSLASDLGPLFETILREVPNAANGAAGSLQMLVSTLDYDQHLGKLGIGRVRRGLLRVGERVSLVTPEQHLGNFKIEKLYINQGIKKVEVEEVGSGDIATIAGVENIEIGQTIADVQNPQPLSGIQVSEPTLRVTVGANTSPLAGREGKFVTSRQIRERLLKEKETNLGLRIVENGAEFVVAGRGELHLAVLIENMRREGFELQVSKPEVIIHNNQEPFDEVTIDVPDEYVGEVTTEMGRRRAEMKDLLASGNGSTRLVYVISQRNFLGVRNAVLTQTRGTAVINSMFLGYQQIGNLVGQIRNGVMIAHESGTVLSYSLENAQERGTTFVEPGEEVYEGMIVGITGKENDMEISVTKGKHLTNTRSANKDIKIVLTPAVKMSLEQGLDFIDDDELMEVTPKNIRFRKKLLSKMERVRLNRRQNANS